MKVCGIDPAPKKGLTVFDGADHDIALEEAVAFVADLASDDDLLVCWDAPLTGPPASVLSGAAAKGAAFTQRPIESFFSRAGTGFKTPKGISVLGYSGCPHWAITRNLLGLPRVGRFDAHVESLPLFPLTDQHPRPMHGCCIVEVHPAVALWLWSRQRRRLTASWLYKKERSVLRELWLELLTVPGVAEALCQVQTVPKSDDELDARVAYVLGRLWLDDPASVVLLGDADTGSFLIPVVPGIVQTFQSFVDGLPNADSQTDDLPH